MESINPEVKSFWEVDACGTTKEVVGDQPRLTKEWFETVENYRYATEPFIHSVAQFTRHHGQRILEIGVGAGTDHLQWARAGAKCFGVDLTDKAVETTRARFEEYGFTSNLQRADAEKLPFEDGFFDVVYSWGVIHHSQSPESILAEVHRVLKPGGVFKGMFYGRRSLRAFRLWLRHGLLAGKPWRSPKGLIYNHVESIGTKAYTQKELRQLFSAFKEVELTPHLSPPDIYRLPKLLVSLIPRDWAWYVGIVAHR